MIFRPGLPGRSPSHRRGRASFRPGVDVLEGRVVLSYVVTDLGTIPGGVSSTAYGINSQGDVVGYSNTATGAQHAFLYSNGVMHDLGTLAGGQNSVAIAVNDQDQVVGESTNASGNLRAFRDEGGVMVDLGTLANGDHGAAWGINASGQVVGVAMNCCEQHAFSEYGGVMRDLGALSDDLEQSAAYGINDRGQIVGSSQVPTGGQHAFLYSDGAMGDLGTLPGGNNSIGYAINAQGQVAGYSNTASGAGHAFLYTAGVMNDLGTLGGTQSSARDINDQGQVVGQAAVADGTSHGFVYSGGVMHDLNSLIPAGSGFTVNSAMGINNRGQIAVDAVDAHGTNHALLLTPADVRATTAIAVKGTSTTTLHSRSITLTGTIRLTPPTTEAITVTLNGVSRSAAIHPNGSFTASFDASHLKPGAYKVSYVYAGDTNFKPATAQSTLDVVYNVVRVAPTKPISVGTPAAITLKLTDAGNGNVGSMNTTVTAVSLTAPNGKSVPLANASGPKAGLRFQFVKTTSQYIFSLKTSGLHSGSYTLMVKVGSDPTEHALTVTIR